jgi:WD40 repeat protein
LDERTRARLETRVVTGGADGTVRLWELGGTSEALGVLKGHTQPVLCVAVTADGTRLASGDQGGTVRLWDLKARKLIVALPGTARREGR